MLRRRRPMAKKTVQRWRPSRCSPPLAGDNLKQRRKPFKKMLSPGQILARLRTTNVSPSNSLAWLSSGVWGGNLEPGQVGAAKVPRRPSHHLHALPCLDLEQRNGRRSTMGGRARKSRLVPTCDMFLLSHERESRPRGIRNPIETAPPRDATEIGIGMEVIVRTVPPGDIPLNEGATARTENVTTIETACLIATGVKRVIEIGTTAVTTVITGTGGGMKREMGEMTVTRGNLPGDR